MLKRHLNSSKIVKCMATCIVTCGNMSIYQKLTKFTSKMELLKCGKIK